MSLKPPTQGQALSLRLFVDLVKKAQAANPSWPSALGPVTCAQWVLESAWGVHAMGEANNPFGIKARPGEPFVEKLTNEVVNGKTVQVTAKFRKFDSTVDAITHHGRLIATGAPYAVARQFKDDPFSMARALTGVYATDPEYGAKLCAILDAYVMPIWNSQAAAA